MLKRTIDVAVTGGYSYFCGLLHGLEDVVLGGTVAPVFGGFGAVE
jgi:hypothetical protein